MGKPSGMVSQWPLRSAESVTLGHPDKVCDRLSDAVVDAALDLDPKHARVAAESAIKDHYVTFKGEVTCNGGINYQRIAREVFEHIGYTVDQQEVIVRIRQQCPDIAHINKAGEQGAGDQGIMTGYAVNEPDHGYLLPEVSLAHQLCHRLEILRRDGTLPWLGPDGKSVVDLVNGQVNKVTIATMHDAEMGLDELRAAVHEQVIVPVVGDISPDDCTINGTGVFVEGGPWADSGLTGRKIVVDQFGPMVPVGGGAFSSKDPTKVDRSAAYMARCIAKTIVVSGRAPEALVVLSYAINDLQPKTVAVITGDAERDAELVRWARDNFDMSPGGIIKYLGLRDREGWRYVDFTSYGHYTALPGRTTPPWEVPADL